MTRSTGRARCLQPHRQPIWRPFYRRLAVANVRTRPLDPDRRRGVLLCSDFSEHTRSPRDAGDGPPLARLSLQVSLFPSPSATLATGVRGILTLAKCGNPPLRQEGGDTSSHARCHRDMATPWRESRETAKRRDHVTPRTSIFSFFLYILILFIIFYLSCSTVYLRNVLF